MCEGFPNQLMPTRTLGLARREANSLFRNILPPNPCGAGFCRWTQAPKTRNFLKANMLEVGKKKMSFRYPGAVIPENPTE